MAFEIANALWRKIRPCEIGRGRAGILMAAVAETPVRWSADKTICADAAHLALTLAAPVVRGDGQEPQFDQSP